MKKIIIVLLLILSCLFAIGTALAEDELNADSKGLVPDNGHYADGSYGLDDFVKILIIASKYILGIVGALAFAMFIYGGVTMLISAGSSEAVTKGKTILTNAIIGLVIVFTSWLIIKFVMETMGLNWQGKIEAPKPATNYSEFDNFNL